MNRRGTTVSNRPRSAGIRPDLDELSRSAFTLVELVMALAVASILFLAMESVLIVASRALPDRNDPLFTSIQAAQTVDQIAREVESALYVSQLSSNSIAFTVADRNGDGIPERISYAWSGLAGDPLLRKYNDGTPVAAVDTVNTFNLVPKFSTSRKPTRGPALKTQRLHFSRTVRHRQT